MYEAPILIDFGKACFLNDTKKKILSDEEKDRYHKELFHIAPEVIKGTCAQSILSDVYSFGVVITTCSICTGIVWVLENLESPGIMAFSTQLKNMKGMEGNKEN